MWQKILFLIFTLIFWNLFYHVIYKLIPDYLIMCFKCFGVLFEPFQSDFRRPRLPDLLLFKGTLFSVHMRPASYTPLVFSSCCLNFLYTLPAWLRWFSSPPSTSISDRKSKSLTDVLLYSEIAKPLSLPADIMIQPILVCSAIESFIWGDSIITSRTGGRWVYTFFMILRDGKLGGWVVLD